MGNHWKSALSKLCEIYSQSNKKIDWVLVGSVGSVLQGCEMEPGDIDIYVRNKEDVLKFAEILNEWVNNNDWLSTDEEPVFNETFPSGFSWTKSNWKICGFSVEVVHIANSAGIPDSLTGDGIWEGGQYIWNLAKQVKVGEYTICTVPLEIQLESNLRRNRQDRIDSIMTTLKKDGYDRELIEMALSSKHLSYFYMNIG